MQIIRTAAVAAAMGLALATAGAQAQPAGSAGAQCVALAQAGKLDEAEPHCKQFAAENPVEGTLTYGDFLLHLKKAPQAALTEYRKVVGVLRNGATPTEPQLAGLEGVALAKFFSGDDSATFEAQRVLRVEPDNLGMLELEVALSNRRGEAPKLEYAERLARLTPKEAAAHIHYARALLKADRNADALAAAKQAIALDPKSALALTVRAMAFERLGDWAQADKDLEAAIKLSPKDPAAYVNRGDLMMGAKRYDEAIALAGTALSVSPGFGGAHALRARARLELGDAAGALADIEAGRRADAKLNWSQLESKAEFMSQAQGFVTRDGLALTQKSHAMVSNALQASLRAKCGTPTRSSTADELNGAQTCLLAWLKTDFKKALPAEVHDHWDSLGGSVAELKRADPLRCSKMPRRSTCLDDALYTQILGLLEDGVNSNLVRKTAEAEAARIDREIGAFNAAVARRDAAINTANFFSALAEALASQ